MEMQLISCKEHETKVDVQTNPGEQTDETEENNCNVNDKSKLKKSSLPVDKESTTSLKNTCDGNAKKGEIQQRKTISCDNQSKNATFDIGKRCNNCAFENNKYDSFEVRCINCFTLECLHCENNCECNNKCCCRELKTNLKMIIEDAHDLLSKQLSCYLSVEHLNSFSSTYEFRLHGGRTTLQAIIFLCCQPKSDESTQIDQQDSACCDSSSKNYLNIFILDELEDQKVHIHLGKMNTKRVVTIYSKAESEKENRFVQQLTGQLKREDIQLSIVNEFSESLEEGTMPVIVTCLLYSRLYSDIHQALSGIKEIFHKKVILVLLHFKREDTRGLALDLQRENKFQVLKYVDFFHQKGLENMENVIKEIKRAIYESR
ncbi:uncharacterized protein LOC128554838 [Mercenaria mercenaria]|uniref:uncharacterized protein LOC128554838 n=1 Tax=Mercenaria mercenaria TaxID=6596 RepID=UPI00234F6E7C|nr:uncharacterized protein LOC128554838 [Mercenaria mercenaria]